MKTLRWWVLLLLFSAGCAGAPAHVGTDDLRTANVEDSSESCAASAGASEEGCYAPSCSEDECGLFRCEDLASPPYALRVAPARSADAATARIQRYWGGAVPLPGREAVFIIPWYRKEELPSVKAARKAISEWKRREKERHHIFPRAFEAYFRRNGIDIHKYTLLVDVAEHRRVHAGNDGGPWNRDWRMWIESQRTPPSQAAHFRHGGVMVERYGLIGVPMTYWQKLAMTAAAGE
ncbi:MULTISPECIES: TIGR02269 family lipoprotein [unclassified Myxococcus]|uniref:SitA6 family polymorphic toxin lipoprotein n=1 Tax=unclassified Myxococcus TaxID=2648731 RepID=UPI001CBDBC7D|nr:MULTISPECIES: TIGR02269 family lipoprotein [unclassified Myxococcus]MBZ4400272.1 TIGR02269 family lipoprotein [Myxococcus sp. AS-1-15]MBZ4407971.1 TIGR02269 family lipoprotein [Myxococcus sp. XM-1-1-1]